MAVTLLAWEGAEEAVVHNAKVIVKGTVRLHVEMIVRLIVKVVVQAHVLAIVKGLAKVIALETATIHA